MSDNAVIAIAAAGGFVLGALLIFFLFVKAERDRAASATAERDHLRALADAGRAERDTLIAARAAAEALATRVPSLTADIDTLRGERDAANTHRANIEGTLKAERAEYAARVEELQRMGEDVQRRFAVLASDVLGKNSEQFLQLVTERFQQHNQDAAKSLGDREKALEALVKPLSESLSKFDLRVGEIEKAREGAYAAMQEQVRYIAEGQLALRGETGRLVQALRSPKTRGRWGEVQLRKVLELAGMTQHVDFVEQSTMTGADGALRPDAVIRLPGSKNLVVDAKTPLEAYLASIEADEAARPELLLQHARQVRAHARALGSKEYWKSLPDSPDFVVMFVPGDAFYAAALEADPTLFEEALRQRVLIATPMNLLALVWTIAYGWRHERMAQNAQEVADLGRDLYERVKTFGEHFGDLGDALRRAVDRYNKSVGSLEGRLLPAARKFEQLGIARPGEAIAPLAPIDGETRPILAAELLPPAPHART